jgi:hypothetical protein
VAAVEAFDTRGNRNGTGTSASSPARWTCSPKMIHSKYAITLGLSTPQATKSFRVRFPNPFAFQGHVEGIRWEGGGGEGGYVSIAEGISIAEGVSIGIDSEATTSSTSRAEREVLEARSNYMFS